MNDSLSARWPSSSAVMARLAPRGAAGLDVPDAVAGRPAGSSPRSA